MEKSFLDKMSFEPLGKNNWDKFTKLFGEKGACGNCWCMYYRLKKKDFETGKKNDLNKSRMEKLVWEERPTGILGMFNEEAIAWCAFAPREDYVKLENSRVHKRIDDKPVWSIPCFFVKKNFRNSGVSLAMLKGVIKYAGKMDIKILEAYPLIPTKGKLPDAFVWVGLYKSFERAGFEIVDRKSKNRPMVRYCLERTRK